MSRSKPSAEEVFRKNSEEMSDMERMMADIMSEEEPVREREHDRPVAEDRLDDIIEEFQSSPVAPAPPSRKARTPQNADAPKARAVSEEEYFSESRKTAQSRVKASGRKKKKLGPAAIILIICAVLVIGAILYKALSEDFLSSIPGMFGGNENNDGITVENVSAEETEGAEDELPPDIYIPTPDPEGENIKIAAPGSIVIISEAPQDAVPAEGDTPSASGAAEHSYGLYVEDVSWTQAQARCAEMGGHLVNISDEAELAEVIALAEEKGIEKLWIGCHRENAQLIWENDEGITFYKWGKGEPSGYDSGDRVTEDYVLLWKFNGEWVYNDSRDDPVRDYPAMYSGQIGFVCEFGAQDPAPALPVSQDMAIDSQTGNYTNIQPDIPG